MTSSFSIYILIGLTYPDYKVDPFASYIDSGSGSCLSKSACFPDEYHTDLPAIQEKIFLIIISFLQKESKTLEFLSISTL